MRSRLFPVVQIIYIIMINNSASIAAAEVSNQLELFNNSELVQHDFCANWSNQSENSTSECSYYKETTLWCYGSPNLTTFANCHRPGKVRQIIFCGWANETFDPSILVMFRRLKTLHFEYGALIYFESKLPYLKQLKHISVQNTRLSRIPNSFFMHLPALTSIDLRWNQLDHYDGSLVLPKKLEALYLSENPYNCSKNFKWLMNYSKAKQVIDRNLLRCGDNLFKNQSIKAVMNIKMSLREMCHRNNELRNCTCILSYISLDLDGIWRPMYSINCSNLNLYRLPASVPENTTTFYAQYNKISKVEPLLDAYRNVHDIYLDYNQISTIEILETDSWLEHFRAFSLKGNHLTQLPVYLLNNALERNTQASALYLSENPWRCECNFMLRFQELLQSHRDIIKDASEIQCKKQNEDQTLFYSVLALKRTDACVLSMDYAIQPIDMLNIVLATLLVFVIVKLSYDYYNYRIYGHLPWIVTKMP